MKTDTKSLTQLQKIFKDRGSLDLEIFPDQYHRTDAYFIGKDKEIEVEVKRRRFASNRYPTTIINKDKYLELLSRKAILAVLFDDCFYIFTNLKEAFVSESYKGAKKTTDGGGDYIYSPKIELNLNKAKRYEY